MQKPRLLTVHGVGYPADWQSNIRSVLEPFFEYSPIEYTQYRSSALSAVLKVIVEPVAFWIAVGLLLLQPLILFYFGPQHHSRRFWLWIPIVTAALSFTVGLVLAYLRRQRAFLDVRRQVEEAMTSGKKVHIVAHSLGTYLASRALEEVVNPSIGRMVFVGSVVKRRFPWDKYTTVSVQCVRNEVGTRDAVVLLAGLVKCLNWRLGWAGWRGFKGSPAVVHTCEDSIPCGRCAVRSEAVAVHNTVCPYYKHNDHFLGPRHAFRYWLPFLWGYNPATFHSFLHRCQEGVKATQDGTDRLREVIEDLHYSSWGGKRSVGQHIVKELRSRLNMSPSEHPVPAKVFEIVTRMWNSVVEAQDAIDDPDYPNRRKHILAYNPLFAIAQAIDEVYP